MIESLYYLSVIIPVYNEEQNIKPLIEKIQKSLEKFSYQVIFVDDCSTDNTREEIKKIKNTNIFLIELKKNYGQSMALAAGIDFAIGDYIVTLDGDLQNDPTDIPEMVEIAEQGNWDVVTGVRNKRKDSFFKTIPSKIANFLIRKLTNLDLKDQGCALKIFTKETAKELNLYGEMHRFINLLAYLNGARITQVNVKHHHRKFGKSKYGLGRTLKVVNDLILIIFQRKHLQKPIYLFGNIGLLFFSLGTLINLYLLVVKIMGNKIGDRPLLTLGVLFIIVGIQFFTMGIIIDLLMRTYFESQKKRPYKIRQIFNHTDSEAAKGTETVHYNS
ncbi:glycosyltransferase family 2 protein [Abyssalbus ytuae]|uniref:Glycosyltransferase family 2 protein n=1 Tax=Abyssalbus ytuae TaxID=2926907 RepID=A0A9E6ZM26_9FLAO|nr:glycosyltransferase family 2 protein [Abyssalbus ytuae]UOB16710.1 glycosyltransferase family 2 protein [Abyssalbus ytuae]